MAGLRDAVPNNLPIPLTSFVGREREIAEVRRLLGGVRLLTLTGAGGCGKTRLALKAAATLLDGLRDGVWVADLAALSDVNLVPYSVASALGLPEQPDRSSVNSLVDALRPKSLLLVLDNCEHVLAGCAPLADLLLRMCTGLRILATSREPLGVPGETIWRVPSLTLPDLQQLPPPDRLMESEAVRLFVERASSARSDFRMTAANALAIAQVVGRLDGMPLAIELAAARVKALTAEQIAVRLDDRFRLLTGGSRTTLPQHRTLRAAMDWSYDLLSERERTVLHRLSAFAGGWTLGAAEAVCAGGEIEASEIFDLLAQLVDRSLVMVDAQDGEARYRLLETVRQYARERLLELGEVDAVRRRHRDWYLALAERAAPEWWGAVQQAWVERLEAEHDNLRVALQWCRAEEGGAEAELRLASALLWFWFIHGDIREGREHLDLVLARGAATAAPARARALCSAGILAWRHDEYDRAAPLIEESLALFRELGDAGGIAFALHFAAHLAETRGEYVQAAAVFEESLAYYRRTGDTWGIGKSLSCMGSAVLRQGDRARAEALISEALPLLRKVGDQTHSASALARLALLADARGDDARATALAADALRAVRETWHTTYVAPTLRMLGQLATRKGDCSQGIGLLRESLIRGRRMGDKEQCARSLAVLAEAALGMRQHARGARLHGASDAVLERIGYPLSSDERASRDAQMAAVHRALGEEAATRAWTEGREMTLDEAIDDALAIESGPPGAAKGVVSDAPGSRVTGLTPREREVAALVAQGLTNREIAAHLVVAERTAEGHVQSILNKLGFNSRAQIAAWAVGHGLHAVTPG